jgi:hypothetical protein
MNDNLKRRPELSILNRALILIDRSPLDALIRAILGFACIPLLALLRLNIHSIWILAIGLLLLMFSLRVVPAFVRRLLPVPPAVRAVWDERRNIAKRYDSFQWQKLFFIGLGLVCYMLIAHVLSTSTIAVSSFCVVSGGIGLVRWYTQSSEARSSTVNQYVL